MKDGFDIVLDTHIFAEFIIQYFNLQSGERIFVSQNSLTPDVTKKINKIRQSFEHYDSLEKGLVVISAFAIVEAARQFDRIFKSNITIEQFKAFLNSPPQWFLIEPLSKYLFGFFFDIPSHVLVSGKMQPIEWADSIHIVTALSRENAVLATLDKRILSIESLKHKLI